MIAAAGTLIVMTLLARRFAFALARRLNFRHSFVLFLPFLGICALAGFFFDPRLRPGALGILPSSAWIPAFFLSMGIGTVVLYPFYRLLWGSSLKWALGWFLVALFAGVVEEAYFRGVWGNLCREPFGPLLGALIVNGVFVWVISPWIRSNRLIRLATLYGFGLSMSWAYEATRSLAVPAGIHAAVFYMGRCWPRLPHAMNGIRPPRYPGLFLWMLFRWLAAPFLIRLLPLKRLLRFHRPLRPARPDRERLKRIPRYLEALMRLFPLGLGQFCLRRCLVLFYFLNRWGEPVTIHFGVKRTETGELVGHSWLTRRDGSLWGADPQVGGFSEVTSFQLKGVFHGEEDTAKRSIPEAVGSSGLEDR